jgi:hypothetical protein
LLYFILYFLAQLFFGQAVVVLLDWSIYGMWNRRLSMWVWSVRAQRVPL